MGERTSGLADDLRPPFGQALHCNRFRVGRQRFSSRPDRLGVCQTFCLERVALGQTDRTGSFSIGQTGGPGCVGIRGTSSASDLGLGEAGLPGGRSLGLGVGKASCLCRISVGQTGRTCCRGLRFGLECRALGLALRCQFGHSARRLGGSDVSVTLCLGGADDRCDEDLLLLTGFEFGRTGFLLDHVLTGRRLRQWPGL